MPRSKKQTPLTRTSSMTTIASSPSTLSTPGSSPAISTTRKRTAEDPVPNDDDSDVEMITPTRPKRQRGLATREKALAFKATFPDGLSNEDILQRQMKGWTSKSYDHFASPTIDASDPIIIKYIFHCKIHPNQVVSRARHDDGTSNFKRHIDRCMSIPEAEAAGQLTMPMFSAGSTYSEAKLRLLIVEWCARKSRPMIIVEDEPFVQILRMLNANVTIPGRKAVSRDIKAVYKISKEFVIEFLSNQRGLKHQILDGWSAPNVLSILGSLISFLKDDDEIYTIVLDCYRLTKSHTGEYLAEKVAESLKEYGLDLSILSMTMDNASNNDKLLTELPHLLPSAATIGTEYQIRCFGHIINLCVKAFLSLFDSSAKALKADGPAAETDKEAESDDERSSGDEDVPEDEEVDEDQEAERDTGDWEEIETLCSQLLEVSMLGAEDKSSGRCTMKKLRKLGKKFRNSDMLQEELAQACALVNITPKKMIRPVDTRWNTMCEVIERAVYLKPALKRLLSQTKHSKGAKSLVGFRLSDSEWTLLGMLLPMLQVFQRVTKVMSQSRRPLVADVIPLIDLLDERLKLLLADLNNPIIIRASAAKGRAVLNKYYSKTDGSKMYRLCMMLHPRYKLAYFTKASWEKTWVDTARRIIQEEWEARYKTTIDPSYLQGVSDIAQKDSAIDDIFKELDRFGRTDVDDVLEAYLDSPTDADTDPIKFWVSRLDKPGAKVTPRGALARMGLDFLTAPATSTDVERLFSHGGAQVSKRRHSISFETLRCLMVLRSWFEAGLVPVDKVLEYFRSLKSRRRDGSVYSDDDA